MPRYGAYCRVFLNASDRLYDRLYSGDLVFSKYECVCRRGFGSLCLSGGFSTSASMGRRPLSRFSVEWTFPAGNRVVSCSFSIVSFVDGKGDAAYFRAFKWGFIDAFHM